MAPHQIACRHDGEIAYEGCPCGAHVAVGDADGRHEPQGEPEHEHEAEEGEIHAPLRAVGELVPQREIEEHSEAELGHHHHRHYAET